MKQGNILLEKKWEPAQYVALTEDYRFIAASWSKYDLNIYAHASGEERPTIVKGYLIDEGYIRLKK